MPEEVPKQGYQTMLIPTAEQEKAFWQGCGTSRWAFNWALEIKDKAFKAREKIPTAIDLHKRLNLLKKTEKYAWLYEVSKCAPQEGLRDCDNAFSHFFRRCREKKPGKKGYPKFKAKRHCKASYRVTGTIKFLEGGLVQLPKVGIVRMAEKDYFPIGTAPQATISEANGKWYISACLPRKDKPIPEPKNLINGVDVGIKALATPAIGEAVLAPRPLKRLGKRLKRKQRQLSRKKKLEKRKEGDKTITIEGKNRAKKRLEVAKLHRKIGNIRADALHKLTSLLSDENQILCIEDLKTSNLLKNKKLARAISDIGFYEFRRQLEYKCKWKGRHLILADTFYPSSQLDHKDGIQNTELTLSDRTIFHKDGTQTDRDKNASINLVIYVLAGFYLLEKSQYREFFGNSSLWRWDRWATFLNGTASAAETKQLLSSVCEAGKEHAQV